jgi:hypothetical protein
LQHAQPMQSTTWRDPLWLVLPVFRLGARRSKRQEFS